MIFTTLKRHLGRAPRSPWHVERSERPVRAQCARIIGEIGWVDGLERLCELLSDVRDANEDAFPAYSSPICHVGRAAASALGSFESSRRIGSNSLSTLSSGKAGPRRIWASIIWSSRSSPLMRIPAWFPC